MSNINREQIVALAADELGVTSVGQTLSPEDQEKIDEKLDALLSGLAARGVIYISNPDSIPEQVQEQLAILLAQACAVSFGKPRDFALRDKIEEELRVVARRQPAPKKYLEADAAFQGNSSMSYARWTRGI